MVDESTRNVEGVVYGWKGGRHVKVMDDISIAAAAAGSHTAVKGRWCLMVPAWQRGGTVTGGQAHSCTHLLDAIHDGRLSKTSSNAKNAAVEGYTVLAEETGESVTGADVE